MDKEEKSKDGVISIASTFAISTVAFIGGIGSGFSTSIVESEENKNQVTFDASGIENCTDAKGAVQAIAEAIDNEQAGNVKIIVKDNGDCDYDFAPDPV